MLRISAIAVLLLLDSLVDAQAMDWAARAVEDAQHDRTSVIFTGETPNKLVCDTALRRLPDGSWSMITLGGGDTEPQSVNQIFECLSIDEGKIWSRPTPLKLAVVREKNSSALVPSEFMIRDRLCTLFFATHDGRFGNWQTWQADREGSSGAWNSPRPAPGRLEARTFLRNHLVTQDGRIIVPFQHYLGPTTDKKISDLQRQVAHNVNNPRNGVIISEDGGKTWSEHGDIRLTKEDVYYGWAENNVVELADGRIAMIIRGDRLGGVLYYAESTDGGRTWPAFASKTDIPNPGSKATLYSLGGDAVALLHNSNAKRRSPLALWISFDGMKSWPYRRVLVEESHDGPKGRLNYPDGFVTPDKQWLHFAYDDNRSRAVYYGAKLPSIARDQ